MSERRYADPAALRQALTDRLRQLARERPGSQLADPQRQFAYDRLLARLFLAEPDVWVSALLLAQVMSFNTTLLPITIGNGLIGVWLLMSASLVLAASALPAPLSWLGIAGGTGLVIASMGFPLLGREHPVIAAGGVVALAGLVGFYLWAGVLLLLSRLAAG